MSARALFPLVMLSLVAGSIGSAVAIAPDAAGTKAGKPPETMKLAQASPTVVPLPKPVAPPPNAMGSRNTLPPPPGTNPGTATSIKIKPDTAMKIDPKNSTTLDPKNSTTLNPDVSTKFDPNSTKLRSSTKTTVGTDQGTLSGKSRPVSKSDTIKGGDDGLGDLEIQR